MCAQLPKPLGWGKRLIFFQHLSQFSGTQREYAAVLKMLQDLTSISGELPSSYWLNGASIDRDKFIGRGGEVLVYEGTHKGNRVVIREVPRRHSFWSTPSGDRIKKVSCKRFFCGESTFRNHSVDPPRSDHAFAALASKHYYIPLLGVTRAYEGGPPMMALPFIENGSLEDYIKVNKLEIRGFVTIVSSRYVRS